MIEVKATLSAYEVHDGYCVATCQTPGQADRIKRALERESLQFLVFAVRDEQACAIQNTLDDAAWRFVGEVGSAARRTDALVAVLEDWKQRVKSEHEAKINEAGDTRTQMHLRLDDDDHRDIMAAVERRKSLDCKPDSDSCELGSMIAEICRGWMERVEHDNPQPPAPAFREGGFYRDRSGQLTGPLERCDDEPYVWQCAGWTYTATGLRCAGNESPGDLVPGEVIVWRHPGLKAGEYRWDANEWLTFIQSGIKVTTSKERCSNLLADWTDPPRVGTWKVSEGQEYATWEGE